MNEKVTLEELKKQIQGQREDKIIVKIGVLNDLISQIEKQQAEIEYWKEQAQGYSDLSKQIKEEYEQRLEDYYNEG